MLKWIATCLLGLSLQAHANDGGIAVIDVLGVAPTVEKAVVKVYGKDTKKLYDVLPITAIPQIHEKSLYIASSAWAVSIYCHEDYERPTNGEWRSDYMCEFGVEPRAGSLLEWEDVNKDWVSPGAFDTWMGGSSPKALGIDPGPKTGKVFSFYGYSASYLATRLPSTLTFSSGTYAVKLACKKNYVRPSNGEHRSDYMCTLSVNPK